MNAIILRSRKQLNKPKAIQRKEGECVAKEKSQPQLEDEVIEVLKIHEEGPRPRVVEPYRPPVPFP